MIEPTGPGPEQTGASSVPGPAAEPAAATEKPAKALTAEEQMALYEQDLKENEWGHQPC